MFLMRTIPRHLTSFVLFFILCGCGGRTATIGSEPPEQLNEDKLAAYDLLAQEKYQAVVDRLNPWIERKAKDPQVFSMTAKALWRLGRDAEAVANYEDALRLDYSDPYSHMELAQILMTTGKTGRALTEFELSIRFGERDPLPHYNYGLALRELGREKEALDQWKVACALAPGSAVYAEAVGIGLTGRDDAAALRYFERADSLGADRPSFHNNFGLLLQRLGDYDRAELRFKEALSGDPDNSMYRRNLGILYMVSARYDPAAAIWEELHREDPEKSLYRIYLARAELGLLRYDAAIALLEDWVVENDRAGSKETGRGGDTGEGPGLDEAYDVLAMSYRGKGDLSRAASFMRRALDMRPDRVEYLTNYGVILAESGNIDEAKRLWKKVLDIDPENATARQNLSVYER